MSDTDKDQPKKLEGPYYYEPEKNPEFIERKDGDGNAIKVPNPDYIAYAGVPNRDISADEFVAFPPHIQRAIGASPIHRKTKPRPAAAPKADTKPAEPAKE